MAAGKAAIIITCPSCGGKHSVSGLDEPLTTVCPQCGIKIRVTLPDKTRLSQEGLEPYDDEEVYRYEKDIPLTAQIPLIKNIVLKDVMGLKLIFLVLFVLGLLIAGALGAQVSTGTEDDLNKTEQEIEKEQKSGVWGHYTLAILITGPLLMLIANHVYGTEVKRGTMRLLCLYPINMNGLAIAKIISIALILGIIQLFILVIPTYPLDASGRYPWLSSVMFWSYFMNVFILITASFATNIVTYFSGKLYISMNRMLIIMISLYLVLTERFMTIIGSIVISLTDADVQRANEIYHSYELLGQDLGQFSPYHAGGRIMNNSLGLYTGGPDILIVLIIGLVFIIGGYILGKRIYLDVFIRE